MWWIWLRKESINSYDIANDQKYKHNFHMENSKEKLNNMDQEKGNHRNYHLNLDAREYGYIFQ